MEIVRVVLQGAAEAQRRLIGAALNVLVQSIKGTAADEEDVGGIDLDELLLRVLAATLRRDRAFQDLQQRLLHALAAHIAGDGRVLAFAGDLVDLIDIDDADLSLLHVEIRCLQELEQDVLHVLANITGLGEGGGVRDGEGHAQHLSQRLCQQRLADAGGAEEQDVGLLQFHVRALAAQDALVMVVDGDRQHTLGLVLPDDVLIQTVLDLLRGQDVDRETVRRLYVGTARAAAVRAVCARMLRLVREQVIAQADALAADVDTGANDHPLHFVLMLAAETANQIFFVFISAGIVVCHSRFSLFWVV